MPRAKVKVKNPGLEQPAPELTQTEIDIAFWLQVAKEFTSGKHEAEIIHEALEFMCLSYIRAQQDLDPQRH